jgi:hypothetical protein
VAPAAAGAAEAPRPGAASREVLERSEAEHAAARAAAAARTAAMATGPASLPIGKCLLRPLPDPSEDPHAFELGAWAMSGSTQRCNERNLYDA